MFNIDIKKLNLTTYKDKMPSNIYTSLKNFTNSEVVLVPNLKKDKIEFENSHAHINVKKKIVKNGGSIVSGWSLFRNNREINLGIYIWVFHSNWLSPNNELQNITIENYLEKNSSKHTFWHDINRLPNFEEGSAFNKIIIFSKQTGLEKFNLHNNDISIGNVYWITPDLKILKNINSSNGKHYWLRPEYQNNLDNFEEESGIKLIGKRNILVIDPEKSNYSFFRSINDEKFNDIKFKYFHPGLFKDLEEIRKNKN